jgi:hypothetical protein
MAGVCVECGSIVTDVQNFGSKSEPVCGRCHHKARNSAEVPTKEPVATATPEAAASREAQRHEALDALSEPVKSSGGGYFEAEKKGIQKGMLGGFVMMVIAVVWFVVGWALGFIFFYPPILFLIGLYSFIKGAATGNFAGKKIAA